MTDDDTPEVADVLAELGVPRIDPAQLEAAIERQRQTAREAEGPFSRAVRSAPPGLFTRRIRSFF